MRAGFVPHAAARCPICRDWFENIEADLEEHFALWHRGVPGTPFWFENQFEVSDANPGGMTPCCRDVLVPQHSHVGAMKRVVCRTCHKDYTGHDGWIEGGS